MIINCMILPNGYSLIGAMRVLSVSIGHPAELRQIAAEPIQTSILFTTSPDSPVTSTTSLQLSEILAVVPALGLLSGKSKTRTGFKSPCHVLWRTAKRRARDGNVAGKAWCEQVLDFRQRARGFHELGQPRAVCFIVRERDEPTEVRQSRILFRVLIYNSQQEVILPSANGSRFPLSGKLKAEEVGR